MAHHERMVTGQRRGGLLLRIYAWLALAGWFGGGSGLVISAARPGTSPWPLLLVVAASVPLIPLLVLRGPGVLGERFARLFGGARIWGFRWIAWPGALAIMAGLCFFAWAARDEGLARERVKSFVMGMGDDAQVLVDGEYFLGDRARSLLDLLAELDQQPAHHSHPEESFLVLLADGERRMELGLRRDSEHSKEYWVYLLNEGTHRELNDIGRITTEVLDDIAPVRSASLRQGPR
jgi:hypothetical protein